MNNVEGSDNISPMDDLKTRLLKTLPAGWRIEKGEVMPDGSFWLGLIDDHGLQTHHVRMEDPYNTDQGVAAAIAVFSQVAHAEVAKRRRTP